MADFEVTFVVDIYRCPGEGIDLFKLLDDSLPTATTGASASTCWRFTHAHDDHIAGIGDLYDRYQVVELWLPQHAKKLQQVAGNYAEFERVQEEHPDEQTSGRRAAARCGRPSARTARSPSAASRRPGTSTPRRIWTRRR